MPDKIPLRYAQSLLRLFPAPREELRAELLAMDLPLVLLEQKTAPDLEIPVEDYGRLFIHLVKKLQPGLGAAGDKQPEKVEVSNEQVALASLMKGVHF